MQPSARMFSSVSRRRKRPSRTPLLIEGLPVSYLRFAQRGPDRRLRISDTVPAGDQERCRRTRLLGQQQRARFYRNPSARVAVQAEGRRDPPPGC
jgi:hypothetical protein